MASGLPALTASLDRQIRSRAEAPLRQRAEAVAREHASLIERRGPALAKGAANAKLLRANEWAHENDEEIASLMVRLGELLRAGRATKRRIGMVPAFRAPSPAEEEEAEGGAAAAAELLREAELRLMAARHLDGELAQNARAAELARAEQPEAKVA